MTWNRLAKTILALIAWGTVLPLWAQQIPTPESVLGQKPGADFFLASYDESLGYFRALADSSDRITLQQVGQTSGGLDWYIALISSASNLADLQRYKSIATRLALAKDLTDQEAQELAGQGRAIVHIDGGLHATEVAHAQHTIQLAYDLVSAQDDPHISRILDEVILVLWFSINPDGQNMVSSWYRRNLGTPYEVSSLPWLYQKYVGHDNNRDGYMNNMVESQVVTRTTLEFNPQVFYNHHQTAPFPARIWIPPFAEPVSRNTHPLMWRWVNLFGTNMAAYLDQRGMPGSIHRGQGFDDWYPGFIDHVNNFRNTVSFLTETALYRYATPHFYTVNDFPTNRRDLRPEGLYASPWKGGWWRLGDAVRYMLGASMSVLDLSARFRESLLYNRYQAGRDAIQRFSQGPPYAYLIPHDQADPQTAALLVQKIRLNGLEVARATQSFQANGRTYPVGTWVIPMNHAYSALVQELFEIQVYPDLRDFPEGPPDLPYDVAGWTLPLQMGVEVIPIQTELPAQVRATFERLEQVAPPAGRLSGNGSVYTFSHRSNVAIRAVNEILQAGGQVAFNSEASDAGQGEEFGAIVVRGADRRLIETQVSKHGLQVTASNQSPDNLVPIQAPRVGVYRPWASSIDEGWTRWLLEDHAFQPVSLYNADMQAGHLNDRVDVIVLADMGSRTILQGHRIGTIPTEFAGGIGDAGLQNLIDFVARGGTLVAFNNASLFAIEQFNLPVSNVLDGLGNSEFFCSGSILRVEVNERSHPVVMGMPAQPNIMFQRGPAFEPKAKFKGSVLARYPSDRNPLQSGFILNPEKIQGKAAVLDAEYEDGHVILIGFRPQWRGQSHGTFKIIFNSLYYFGVASQTAAVDEQAANIKLQLWEGIKRGIGSDLESLVSGNREFAVARGLQAVEAARRLDSLIAEFEKERFPEISELKDSLDDSAIREQLAEYASQLKTLLVDLRAKDLSVVEYSPSDLTRHYRLDSLEKSITDAIRQAR